MLFAAFVNASWSRCHPVTDNSLRPKPTHIQTGEETVLRVKKERERGTENDRGRGRIYKTNRGIDVATTRLLKLENREIVFE